MGDSYASAWGSGGRRNIVGQGSRTGRSDTVTNTMFKEKDLMMMPARLAIALQDDGWHVRSDIVWHKPNPMPESVTDRPTNAHEYVFMLTKSARYWADMDAVREGRTEGSLQRWNGSKHRIVGAKNEARTGKPAGVFDQTNLGGDRNLRSVWTIATQPTKAAHFATFPQALVERCVKMGAPAKTCAECGAGWVRVVEHKTATPGQNPGYLALTNVRNDGDRAGHFVDMQRTTKGFRPSCECKEHYCTECGFVLQSGNGTNTHSAHMRSLRQDLSEPQENSEVLQRRVQEQGAEDSTGQGMSTLQEGVSTRETRSGILQQAVFIDGDSAQSPELTGVVQDDARIHSNLQTGSPQLDKSGLCDAAPFSDGGSSGSLAGTQRSSASHQRREGGQSPGKSDSDEQEQTRPNAKPPMGGSVPELQSSVPHSGTCPRCKSPLEEKPALTQPGIVLDIFMGSGTTALVARRLGRDYIGCDLSQEYVDMANQRLRDSDPLRETVLPDGRVQMSLFQETA